MANNGTSSGGKYTVRFGNNDYVTVAGRLAMAHQDNETLSIDTELISVTDEYVLFRATVTTKKGTFTGYAASYLKSGTAQEKKTPFEVAETSAVGRAFGLAGYGSEDSIASADEVQRSTGGGASHSDPQDAPQPTPTRSYPQQAQSQQAPRQAGPGAASEAQIKAIYGIASALQIGRDGIAGQVQKQLGKAIDDLTKQEASRVIEGLKRRQEQGSAQEEPQPTAVQVMEQPPDWLDN